MVLLAKDFKYPSKEERENACANYPKIKNFGFEQKTGFEFIEDVAESIKENNVSHNLYWWDNCLTNRLGKLHETYVYLHTHYHRGFEEDILKCNKTQAVNKLQFQYYTEVFYYFYVSTKDIIYQIINLYNKNDLPEDNVTSRNLKSKLMQSSLIREELIQFEDKINSFLKNRNAFAHRFTPSLPDYKTEYRDKTIEFKSGEFLNDKDIFLEINLSLSALRQFIEKLKKCFLENKNH